MGIVPPSGKAGLTSDLSASLWRERKGARGTTLRATKSSERNRILILRAHDVYFS
jgi:hypothetical protein